MVKRCKLCGRKLDDEGYCTREKCAYKKPMREEEQKGANDDPELVGGVVELN